MPDTARMALQNDDDDIIITVIIAMVMKSLVYHVEPRTIVFLIWEAGNQVESKTAPKQMKLKFGLLVGK